MRVCIYMYVHTRIRNTHTYKYIYTHIYTYIYVCVYIYTLVHIHRYASLVCDARLTVGTLKVGTLRTDKQTILFRNRQTDHSLPQSVYLSFSRFLAHSLARALCCTLLLSLSPPLSLSSYLIKNIVIRLLGFAGAIFAAKTLHTHTNESWHEYLDESCYGHINESWLTCMYE